MPSVDKASKSAKDKTNKDICTMDDVEKEAKSIVKKVLGDISKTSATKQIILGASSGWVTGFLAMRVGKTAALALGGGIILLQIANEKGYIKINWDKVSKNLDKVADKVEEKVTGQKASWTDKAEKYVDRTMDKAERNIKRGQQKAKSWFSKYVGDEDGNVKLKEVHIFVVSFAAGVAIGIGTA